VPKLVDIEIDEISGVDKAANRRKFLIVKRDIQEDEELNKAQWTRAYINDLPDEAFAVIEPGGKKDEEGKTTPRRLRHLPYRDKDGKIDIPHLRNALARLPQTDLPNELKEKARRVLEAAAKEAGIGEYAKADNETTLKDRLWGFVKGLFGKEDDLSNDDNSDIEKLYEELNKIQKAGRAISAPRLRMLQQMKELLDQLIADGLKYLEDADIERPDIEKRKEGDKMSISEKVRKNLPEEVQKYIEELEGKATQVDELTKKVTELEKKDKKDDKKDNPEDIWKGVNPVIRKRMEELEKRAKEAEELAKAEKEKREHQEFLKRAEQYPHIGKAEEVADMLKKAYEVSEEYGKKLEATFKATNEQVEKSMLFDEIGRSGSTGGSAIQKAEALANEMIQKNTGMTREQAMAKVWIEHPELYAEYEKEMRGGAR